jgi:hypothetical protein
MDLGALIGVILVLAVIGVCLWLLTTYVPNATAVSANNYCDRSAVRGALATHVGGHRTAI